MNAARHKTNIVQGREVATGLRVIAGAALAAAVLLVSESPVGATPRPAASARAISHQASSSVQVSATIGKGNYRTGLAPLTFHNTSSKSAYFYVDSRGHNINEDFPHLVHAHSTLKAQGVIAKQGKSSIVIRLNSGKNGPVLAKRTFDHE
jgi:hypothetical protein